MTDQLTLLSAPRVVLNVVQHFPVDVAEQSSQLADETAQLRPTAYSQAPGDSTISPTFRVTRSLTIAAEAERSIPMWPSKGETDPWPPLGAAYWRNTPVSPNQPMVPVEAPAALRLPVIAINGQAAS